MRTKIVYVLVSDNSDYYWEQALISIHSLKIYNSDAIIELVIDKETEKTLYGKRSEIRKYVSEIHTIEIPSEFDKKQRSRYLKTNLRKFISDDFLFIDTDTIICGDLSSIDKVVADVSAVADYNNPLELREKGAIGKCKKIGFDNVEGMPYFNSGVMLVHDTPKAKRLYEDWHKNWLLSCEKNVNLDQPALCMANIENDFLLKELSGVWNCQYKIDSGYRLLKKALIIHYFGWGINEYTHLHHNYIFERIKEYGGIDSLVDNVIKQPKTILCTALDISSDLAFRYYFSERLFLCEHRPRFMNFMNKITHFLYILLYGKE